MIANSGSADYRERDELQLGNACCHVIYHKYKPSAAVPTFNQPSQINLTSACSDDVGAYLHCQPWSLDDLIRLSRHSGSKDCANSSIAIALKHHVCEKSVVRLHIS